MELRQAQDGRKRVWSLLSDGAGLGVAKKKKKDSFKGGKNQLKGKQSTFLAISESECAFFRDFLAMKMFYQHI